MNSHPITLSAALTFLLFFSAPLTTSASTQTIFQNASRTLSNDDKTIDQKTIKVTEVLRLLENKKKQKRNNQNKNVESNANSNDYLETLTPEISWYYLPLIMLDESLFDDAGTGGFTTLVFGQDNTLVNNQGMPIGRLKSTCIGSTNLQCTWTIWSALLGSQGCTFMAQGIYIKGDSSFGIPPDQFVAITGGTGQCRGITGEIKISPRNLEAVPPTWDFEVFYDLES